MKDDPLENFVRQHAAGFDILEPDPGLIEKLNLPKRRRNTATWLKITVRAAAVIVIFLGSYGFLQWIQNTGPLAGKSTMKLNPEVAEIEMYYARQMEEKWMQVQPLLLEYPDLKGELDKDLVDLDSLNAELKKELVEGIDNQQVIESMITNYRMKIRILEDLLKELNGDQNENNSNTFSL